MKSFPLRSAAAGAVLALASASALAQAGAWIDVQPPASPPYRATEGLAFEPRSGLVVAYGGVPNQSANPVFSDTWAFDGDTWMQLFPVGNPGPRFNAYLAASPTPGRLVMFGGGLAPAASHVMDGTTWEFDTQTLTWTDMTPAGPSPAARQLANIVYDSWRGRTVLFGGTNGFGSPVYGDTWEWDGAAWTNVSPVAAPAPPPRAWHAMAFDSARGRTVLFGGYDGRQLGDTWEWDGAQWTRIETLAAPSARSSGAIAYDPSTRRVVLFAGSHGWPIGLNDTWEYDGTNWAQVPIAGPVPPPQYLHRMVEDPVRGGILVYGAFGDGWTPLNETWRYRRQASNERDVPIDIRPGSATNPVSLSSRGVVAVAVLTTNDFDAGTVLPATACFGDEHDPAQRSCAEAHGRGHLEDVDGDGDVDLVLHYAIAAAGIDPGDTSACLTGRTRAGSPIAGCDRVTVR
jgi:hypothetical protein